MIISHKYKFLFIGLPFSASSAISKELYLKYDGEPFLNKHSLYHDFKKVAKAEERKFFVFAVLRNPMQIAVTVYEKMKANTKGNFTNPELFLEKGGHITKKAQRDV
jgi:predicted acetyltransferase